VKRNSSSGGIDPLKPTSLAGQAIARIDPASFNPPAAALNHPATTGAANPMPVVDKEEEKASAAAAALPPPAASSLAPMAAPSSPRKNQRTADLVLSSFEVALLSPEFIDTILGFFGKGVRDVAPLAQINSTICHGLKGLLCSQRERHARLSRLLPRKLLYGLDIGYVDDVGGGGGEEEEGEEGDVEADLEIEVESENGEMDPALTLATRAKAVAAMLPDPVDMLDFLLILPGSQDMTQYEDCREPLRKLFTESLPLRVLRSHYLYRCADAELLVRCLNCPEKVRCNYKAAFECGKLVGFVQLS